MINNKKLFKKAVKGIEEQKAKGLEFDHIGVAIPLIDDYGLVVWCDIDLGERYYLISIRKNFQNPEKNWGIEELEVVSQSDDYNNLEISINEIMKTFKTKLKRKIDYPEHYPELSEEQIEKILKHCKRYNIKPDICAYYEDWEDFCSDWCDDIGYTRTEARKKLHGGEGEFMFFKDWGIIRFSL